MSTPANTDIEGVAKFTDWLKDLTPAEKKVVRLHVAGHTHEQISTRLFLSIKTVGSHLYNIRKKLHAHGLQFAPRIIAIPQAS